MEDSNFSDDLDDVSFTISSKKTKKTGRNQNVSRNGKKRGDGGAGRHSKWHDAKKSNSYYWTEIENRKYVQFLKVSGNLLLLPPNERKIKKVNLTMSKRIKTRNPTQCHTHHQKMMGKHGSIEQIIAYYEFLTDGKKSEEHEDQIIEKQSEKNIEVLNFQAEATERETVSQEIDLKVEPAFISLENIIVDEERFENYFEIQDRQLLEWIDW